LVAGGRLAYRDLLGAQAGGDADPVRKATEPTQRGQGPAGFDDQAGSGQIAHGHHSTGGSTVMASSMVVRPAATCTAAATRSVRRPSASAARVNSPRSICARISERSIGVSVSISYSPMRPM